MNDIMKLFEYLTSFIAQLFSFITFYILFIKKRFNNLPAEAIQFKIYLQLVDHF